MRNAAVLLVWAHASMLDMLPYSLYGLLKVSEECCRSLCIAYVAI